jgi:hypothetical protein
LRDHRILARHNRMPRDLLHSGEGAEAKSGGPRFDSGQILDRIDVDQHFRASDIELQEIEDCRSTGDEPRARGSWRTLWLQARQDGFERSGVCRAIVSERTHHALLIWSLACAIAATMLG